MGVEREKLRKQPAPARGLGYCVSDLSRAGPRVRLECLLPIAPPQGGEKFNVRRCF